MCAREFGYWDYTVCPHTTFITKIIWSLQQAGELQRAIITIILSKLTSVWNKKVHYKASLYTNWGTQYILLSEFLSQLLLPQELYSFNNGSPGGGRVCSPQPDLQHFNQTEVGVTAMVCLNAGKVTDLQLNSNHLPLACNFVVEGSRKFLQTWCLDCTYIDRICGRLGLGILCPNFVLIMLCFSDIMLLFYLIMLYMLQCLQNDCIMLELCSMLTIAQIMLNFMLGASLWVTYLTMHGC